MFIFKKAMLLYNWIKIGDLFPDVSSDIHLSSSAILVVMMKKTDGRHSKL